MSECFRRGDLGAGHLLLHTFLDPSLGRLSRGKSRSISD